MVINRAGRKTCPQIVCEKICRLGLRLLVAQVVLPGRRDDLVTSRLFHSILAHENERVTGEKCHGREAYRDHPVFHHEFHGARMGGQKTLNGPGMRFGGIGGNDGFLQCKKLFAGANSEAVMGLHHEIGLITAGQLEAYRHAPRSGVG